MEKPSKLLTLCMLFVFSLVMASTALAKSGNSNSKGNGVKSTVATPTTNTVTDNAQETNNEDTKKNETKEFKNNVKVKGNEVKFDVPPLIKDGRTLIPVRGLMNSLGAEIAWDETTQTVTVTKDDKVVVLTLGSDTVLVNGEETTIDAPAQLVSNRTVVPLRFLAETFGKIVIYDENTGEIDIDDQVPSTTETGTDTTQNEETQTGTDTTGTQTIQTPTDGTTTSTTDTTPSTSGTQPDQSTATQQ